jgi:RimJ/RimL family protein N-acetyltransferase
MVDDGFTSPPLGAADREFRTARLLLRQWRPADREPFAALNADPVVMEHFPAPLSRHESDRVADRIDETFRDRGFGLWAVEVPGEADFIGFVGLSVPRYQTEFTPCVEIGWRLAAAWWGRGYATEAALASLGQGFEKLGLAEIVSFTAVINTRSRRVMERIGMTCSPKENFDHPMVDEGHRLRRHVLYRMTREEFRTPQSLPPSHSARSKTAR